MRTRASMGSILFLIIASLILLGVGIETAAQVTNQKDKVVGENNKVIGGKDKVTEQKNGATEQKEKENIREFAGIKFGVGLSLTIDLGKNDRVSDAEVVNKIVKVKKKVVL